MLAQDLQQGQEYWSVSTWENSAGEMVDRTNETKLNQIKEMLPWQDINSHLIFNI